MADLPARDTWVATDDTLTRWRAEIDTIQVVPAQRGKILRLTLYGRTEEIDLSEGQARHLARLLMD